MNPKHIFTLLPCIIILTACVQTAKTETGKNEETTFFRESCTEAKSLYEQGKIQEFVKHGCTRFAQGLTAQVTLSSMALHEEPEANDDPNAELQGKIKNAIKQNIGKLMCTDTVSKGYASEKAYRNLLYITVISLSEVLNELASESNPGKEQKMQGDRSLFEPLQALYNFDKICSKMNYLTLKQTERDL